MPTNQTTKKSAQRPASLAPQQKKSRLWLCGLILVVLCMICGLIGCLGFTFFPRLLLSSTLPGNGTGSAPTAQSQDAASVASAFMQDLQTQSYAKAYPLLDASLLITLSQPDFIQQAQHADTCAGPVQSFQLTASSPSGQTASYHYTVTRAKVAQPISFDLTLKADQGSWFITSYGSNNSLIPSGLSTC